MNLLIEPNPPHPHHCHFHTIVLCNKHRIIESPEPDRCRVTELPCQFRESMSKSFDDKLSRQREYGIRILQYGAYFEYLTIRKLLESLKQKGVELRARFKTLIQAL
jgi:hypothetical protein